MTCEHRWLVSEIHGRVKQKRPRCDVVYRCADCGHEEWQRDKRFTSNLWVQHVSRQVVAR